MKGPSAGVAKSREVEPTPLLRFEDGPVAGVTFALEREVTTVGRSSSNGCMLDDPRVSRTHALIRKVPCALILTDLGSSSGTKHNDRLVVGPTVVRNDDRVGFGPIAATIVDPTSVRTLEEMTLEFVRPDTLTDPQLSRRQLEVLVLMARGLTNAAIGTALGISERTVKTYARGIYGRLEAHNRAEAVGQAYSLGMLPADQAATPR
jgi:DNA-binding CsgD family transcriptional regulator